MKTFEKIHISRWVCMKNDTRSTNKSFFGLDYSFVIPILTFGTFYNSREEKSSPGKASSLLGSLKNRGTKRLRFPASHSGHQKMLFSGRFSRIFPGFGDCGKRLARQKVRFCFRLSSGLTTWKAYGGENINYAKMFRSSWFSWRFQSSV